MTGDSKHRYIGKFSFVKQDAQQFANWGFDYLKYDWNPNHAPETAEMANALRASGRDIVYSLSNSTKLADAPTVTPLAQCWRTTGDITDSWSSVMRITNAQQAWSSFQSPGHFNDPDMLVVGWVGWGHPRPTRLTPDEQYTHISLWCLFSAPLLMGCDLTKLDAFTMGLLTNDEVLAIDQDAMADHASCVNPESEQRVYVKKLEDGSKAIGLVNLGAAPGTVSMTWAQGG